MSKLAALLRERMRMLKEDALAVAHVVEEAFKGESELDDDRLDPHMRQLFYDLQDENILRVRRQEYQDEGRQLRGYYWRLDESKRPAEHQNRADPMEDLYGHLKDQAWQRRQK